MLQAFFDSFLCAYWNKRKKWNQSVEEIIFFFLGKRAIIMGVLFIFILLLFNFVFLVRIQTVLFLVICSYWISFIHKKYQINVCLKNFLSFCFVCNVEISFIKKLTSLCRSMTSLQSLSTSRWQISHNDLMTFVNANRKKSKNK